jgi:hypothetical protein
VLDIQNSPFGEFCCFGKKGSRYTFHYEKGFARQDENLEKLAMMVANGFARVDGRFADVDSRFEKVDQSLQAIRGDMLRQGDRFVSQEAFNVRVSALEGKVKAKTK